MPHVPSHQMACEIEHLFAESLDAVDVGILRLDADLKVRFANRRFIEIWAVPEGLMQGELVADFQSLIRRNDVLGRLGGEKFAVLPTGHIVRSRVRCRGTAARPGGRGVP